MLESNKDSAGQGELCLAMFKLRIAWQDCGIVNEGSLGGSDMGGLPLSGNLISGRRPRLDMIHCSDYTFTSD